MKKVYLLLLVGMSIVIIGASCSMYPPAPAPAPVTPTPPTSEQPAPVVTPTPQVVPPTQPPVVIPPKTTSAKADVSIANFSFSPATITINKGMTVVWTNNDSAPHQIASDNGTFNSNPLSNGDSFAFTFSTPGTFTYHCAIHPSMTGTVIVK